MINIDTSKIIERLENISSEDFQAAFISNNHPIIITDETKKWSAITKWNLAFFKNNFSDNIVNVSKSNSKIFSLDHTYDDNYMSFKKVLLGEALKLIFEAEQDNGNYYLTHLSIEKYLPELLSNFSLPSWVPTSDSISTNLWIGAKDNTTPLHFDEPQNILTQIKGRKLIKLYSPSCSAYLYPYPINKAVIEKSMTLNEQKNSKYFYPYNHSQIPNINQYDKSKYKDFGKVNAIEVVLEAGEILYIPSGWWHQVRSIDDSISINMSWKPKLTEVKSDHVLRYNANYLFWSNTFADIHKIIDTESFVDFFAIAKHLMMTKEYWLSVIFLFAYVLSKPNVNITHVTVQTIKETLIANGDEKMLQLIDMLEKGIEENNALFTNQQIKYLCNVMA